jgi:hypothetical protein
MCRNPHNNLSYLFCCDVQLAMLDVGNVRRTIKYEMPLKKEKFLVLLAFHFIEAKA